MEEEASWASWMGQLVVGKEGKGEGKMWAAGLGCLPAHARGGEVGRGCGPGQAKGLHIIFSISQ
jgi:hypothetical protein